MGKEGWKRTCPPGSTSLMLRRCVSLCGSTKHCPGPVWWSAVAPVALVVWTSAQPGWGYGEELVKEGGEDDLKIVPSSFLQLSFMMRKRA